MQEDSRQSAVRSPASRQVNRIGPSITRERERRGELSAPLSRSAISSPLSRSLSRLSAPPCCSRVDRCCSFGCRARALPPSPRELLAQVYMCMHMCRCASVHAAADGWHPVGRVHQRLQRHPGPSRASRSTSTRGRCVAPRQRKVVSKMYTRVDLSPRQQLSRCLRLTRAAACQSSPLNSRRAHSTHTPRGARSRELGQELALANVHGPAIERRELGADALEARAVG